MYMEFSDTKRTVSILLKKQAWNNEISFQIIYNSETDWADGKQFRTISSRAFI